MTAADTIPKFRGVSVARSIQTNKYSSCGLGDAVGWQHLHMAEMKAGLLLHLTTAVKICVLGL